MRRFVTLLVAASCAMAAVPASAQQQEPPDSSQADHGDRDAVAESAGARDEDFDAISEGADRADQHNAAEHHALIELLHYKLISIVGVAQFYFAPSNVLLPGPQGPQTIFGNTLFGPYHPPDKVSAHREASYAVVFQCGTKLTVAIVYVTDSITLQQEAVLCP